MDYKLEEAEKLNLAYWRMKAAARKTAAKRLENIATPHTMSEEARGDCGVDASSLPSTRWPWRRCWTASIA